MAAHILGEKKKPSMYGPIVAIVPAEDLVRLKIVTKLWLDAIDPGVRLALEALCEKNGWDIGMIATGRVITESLDEALSDG